MARNGGTERPLAISSREILEPHGGRSRLNPLFSLAREYVREHRAAAVAAVLLGSNISSLVHIITKW